MKEQTTARAGIAQRAWALLLAVALVLGLAPSAAWADGETFSVALTVVDTSDPEGGVLYNGRVDGMTSGDTVADLLAEAGFSEADSAEATEGDDRAYFDSYGSPVFRGNKSVDNGDGTWSYWATMFDGDSAAYASAQLTSALSANGHYQYVYTSESTFEYSDAISKLVMDAVNDPLDGAVAPEPDPDPQPEPEPGDPSEGVAVVDEVAYRGLFSSIAASYEGTSEEWKALELAAAGKAASVDVATLLANAQNGPSEYDTTFYQRFVLALAAVGEEERAEALADALARTNMNSQYVTGLAFALIAYDSVGYEASEGVEMSEAGIVESLLESQLPTGGWEWSGSGAEVDDDADTTAMVLAALASRADDDPRVADAVDRGLEALRAMQYDDGGFRASGEDASDPVNANSTAMVVVALCALGIDPAAEWAVEGGAAPLSALLTQASADGDAFLYAGQKNDFATEQGFRALVAYQGFKNTNAAYNIYTQAKLGQAALPVGGQDDSTQGGGDQVDEGAHAVEAAGLAKTGDGSLRLSCAVAALALGALATGVVAARRSRSLDALRR